MKKGLILLLGLIFSLSSHALSSYEASYDLYINKIDTNIHLGNAEFKLEINDETYTYTSSASVRPLLSIFYNYSRDEKSSGLILNQQLISNYYKLFEHTDDSVDIDFEINISTEQNLSMIGEAKVVDELSLYLALSQDINNQPDQKVFTYQVAGSEGITPQNFTVLGNETIEINGEEVQTIKIECLELRLTLNLSEAHDYLPVLIKKTNGKSLFHLILTDYRKQP